MIFEESFFVKLDEEKGYDEFIMFEVNKFEDKISIEEKKVTA